MADNLSKYRSKRDFKQTLEPSGEVEIKASNRRRFVIQKHDATRLHYDLRIELDGVFKSRAVTTGPSLDPVDKRLAVEVEDHRNFARLRREKGLTQEDVEARSGFSQQYLSGLERGKRNPSIVTLYEITQALGVSHVELISPDHAD